MKRRAVAENDIVNLTIGLVLVSFLFFAWLLQPKATHCCILTVRSNHDTSSARSALRAIQDGGRGNFKRVIGPIFGSR